MTIAMCYLSPEGVVFGADSTSTFKVPGLHFYNHNQKIFEVGQKGTLGLVTWGCGGLTGTSYRSLVAQYATELDASSDATVLDAVTRWVSIFYAKYVDDPSHKHFQMLIAKLPHVPGGNDPLARTQEEEQLVSLLRNHLIVGFCVGGRLKNGFTCSAFEMVFRPGEPAPAPVPIPMGHYGFWGVPDVIHRLFRGFAPELPAMLLSSGKWAGTEAELETLLGRLGVSHPTIPIRDAVDFVHSAIYTTIKTLKFSVAEQVCGGPIEVAVVTTDRDFRWVRHKAWDAAIRDGEPE